MPVVPAPSGALAVFGAGLPGAERYATLLAGPGVERGLIGPRELDRLWDRHLLNCAVVSELVPDGAEVLDLGSGAGLPGIVLALIRPDLSIVMLEPLLRRALFLNECVAELRLPNVRVHRARAEEVEGTLSADVVTARAVAPLARLAGWALPLLRPGGRLLALKGERAAAELVEARPILEGCDVRSAEVLRVGQGKVEQPTTIVRIVVGPSIRRPDPRRPGGGGRRQRGRKR